MKAQTVTEYVGEDTGPVDWTHPIARDKPQHWRDAEQHPERYRLQHGTLKSFRIVKLCMYDGWPYWIPRPAIAYIGPLGSVEWDFFDSYGVTDSSIFTRELRQDDTPTTGGE